MHLYLLQVVRLHSSLSLTRSHSTIFNRLDRTNIYLFIYLYISIYVCVCGIFVDPDIAFGLRGVAKELRPSGVTRFRHEGLSLSMGAAGI